MQDTWSFDRPPEVPGRERRRYGRLASFPTAVPGTDLLEVIDLPLGTVDPQWRITYMNRAAEKALERDREDVLGRVCWELFPEVVGTVAFDVLQRAMRARTDEEYEHDAAVMGGRIRTHAQPLPGGGLLVYIVRVDERDSAEPELRAARELARQAELLKTQVAATLSHELRTPLTSIIGLADLLQSELTGPMTARQLEQLRRMTSAAWHMIGIIDQVLALARADSGRETVAPVRVDVAALLREVVALAQVRTGSAVAVQLRGCEDALPATCDDVKLRQILTNLLSNAMRYTDAGWVIAELGATDERFTLRVHDTGPGIPPDQLEEIFEPFVRLADAGTRPGTGLGLAVSRRLARLLGGDITVESTPGLGSVFTLELPRGAA